jgi:membrane protein DedA with SNARE-associated domain
VNGNFTNCFAIAAKPGVTQDHGMHYLHESYSWLVPHIAAYGAITIFVIIYFESFGAPLPGETGVITAALLASQGEMSIVAVYVAVVTAAILGDSTGYLIGHVGGRRVLQRFGPYIKLTPDRLEMLEGKFRRGGLWFIAVARFLPLCRQLNGVIAGSMAMPFHLFLAANAVGAFAWTTVYVLGPYFFGHLFHHAVR